jgi:hypothetical protein
MRPMFTGLFSIPSLWPVSKNRPIIDVREDLLMRGILAAIIAISVLWMADLEMNNGRYSNVPIRAIMSLIGK